MRVIIHLVFILALPIVAFGETPELVTLEEGIPRGILARVFPIRVGTEQGTCFVVDVNERQYLVTARHVVAGARPGESVEIYRHNTWHPITYKPIFPKSDKIDAVALVLDTALTPKLALPVGMGGIVIGQKVFFLGYPFGLASRSKGKNDFIPFVKAGILSAIDYGDEEMPIVYVDGHNNPGFSGGPIIFSNMYDKRRLQIGAVVSGYRNQPTEVVDLIVPESSSSENVQGSSSQIRTKKVQVIRENTGIVVGYQLEQLVEAIKGSPIDGEPQK